MKIVVIGVGSTALNVVEILLSNHTFSIYGFVGVTEENKKNFKELNFIEFDIINDQDYPDVDLIHIRDCFFHFSLTITVNCFLK